MINYLYDCYRILNKVYSDGAFLKQAILSTDIEEKNRALTVKTCYGVLDNDIRLSYYIKKLCEKSPKLVIRTILKIAMYDMEFLGKRDYAVIDNAVELTKKLGKGGASGFVNAVLRKFIKSEIPLPEKGGAEYFSVKYSYPVFAVEKIIRDYGEKVGEEIMGTTGGKTFVRFEKDGEKYLTEHGVRYEKTCFENLFVCENFVRNADFDKGIYTFQSIGSVAICDVVEKGEKLLDCCSAPGGKSVLLSDKFDSVTACDVYPHRAELIKAYANRMGKKNIEVVVADSSVFNPDFKGRFDAVLCDVPCSSYGVASDNPDVKLDGKIKDINEIKKVQLSILENVSKYVKTGGFLYYSTCSIFFEENIENVRSFLKNHDEYEIVKTNSELPHSDVDGTMQFLPNISMGQGFYTAKLKRVKQ